MMLWYLYKIESVCCRFFFNPFKNSFLVEFIYTCTFVFRLMSLAVAVSIECCEKWVGTAPDMSLGYMTPTFCIWSLYCQVVQDTCLFIDSNWSYMKLFWSPWVFFMEYYAKRCILLLICNFETISLHPRVSRLITY